MFGSSTSMILLTLSTTLIFFGQKTPPVLAHGLGQGTWELKKATRNVFSPTYQTSLD